jgi:putative ABC transport system permease protein
MNIQFTLAARYLLGRKLRTFLTTLAIIFGVMIIFGLNGVIPAFVESFRQNMLAAAGKVDLTVTSETDSAFGLDMLEKVQNVDGIAHATGSLRRNVTLPSEQQANVLTGKSLAGKGGSTVSAVTVAGIDPTTAQYVRTFNFVSGNFWQEGDVNVMVITESLAKELKMSLGSTFTLPSATGAMQFEIVGIITARALPGVEEVYVPLEAAQALFDQTGKINTIEAIFTPGADSATVESTVKAALGNGYKIGALESGIELLATINMGVVAINLFGVMAVVMGGFIIFNTFRTVVAERRRDIGMLRAVGASRRAILGLVITESLLQGVMGTLLGLLAGYGFVKILLYAIGPIFAQYLHFSLVGPMFTLLTFIFAIVMGVGVTLLAGLYPALSASRVSPLDALRPTTGEAFQRVAGRGAVLGAIFILAAVIGLISGKMALASLGTVLFLVGLVLVAPALIRPLANLFGRLLVVAFAREGRLAQGNLARQPGRAAITASAMMIGLAILLTMSGVVSSILSGFLGYLDKTLGADFLFMPQSLVLAGGNVGASPELAQKIRQTPGIEAVTSVRLGMTVIKGAKVQVIGIDPATFSQISGLEFSAGDETQVYGALEEGRALIVNNIFALQNGIHIGDILTLKTPEGDQQYLVVGIGVDYLNAKLSTTYISQANLERDFHQNSDLLIMARKAPNADTATVQAALEALAKDYPAFTLFASSEWRDSQKQIFNQAMGFLYVLLIALTFPSLIALVNTLAINVIERTREIGVIRAVGGTQRQVQRMILAESLLLAAAGTAFGILAGLWLGYVLVGALKVGGFVLPYYFPYAGILVTIAIGLLFGVLASLIPARQAARLNIVTALHYE